MTQPHDATQPGNFARMARAAESAARILKE